MLGRPSRSLRTSVRQVADFWSWWSAEGRAAALAMIGGADPDGFIAAISARTDAIDRRLSWHTEPGAHREHRLVLSAAGAIEARATAERWRRAAPADDLWEFAASRRGDVPPTGAVLSFADVEVAMDDLRFRTTPRGRVLDVAVHHPTAGAAIDARQRGELGMLLVDLVLGEDEVERRVRRIDLRPGGDADGLTADQLVDEVRRLGRDSSWTLMQAAYRDGSVGVIQLSPDLHPLDHLPFDRHSLVEIRYRPREDGLAERPEIVRVQDVQAAIEQSIGGLATTVVTEMRRGVRTVHLYSDSADRNAADLLDRAVRGGRGVRIRHRYDPEWQRIARYRDLAARPSDDDADR